MSSIPEEMPLHGNDVGETARGSCGRPITSRYGALAIVGLLTGLGLVGCGASPHSQARSTTRASRPKPPPLCAPSALRLIAHRAGIGAAALKARATRGGNDEPECDFRGPGVFVAVNVDSSPQPYQRLERTIDEAGQQFGTERNFSPPVTVPRLGLDAAWLPDQSKLLTSDGRILLTITVTWRGKKPAQQLALATLIARRYLGKPIPNGAVPTGEV